MNYTDEAWEEEQMSNLGCESVADLISEVIRLQAYTKKLSDRLVKATQWAYKQVCYNDSAMMDFDDYIWGEEE
jgi:hypothetical protein